MQTWCTAVTCVRVVPRFETPPVWHDPCNTRGRVVLSSQDIGFEWMSYIYIVKCIYRLAVRDEGSVRFRIVYQNVDNIKSHSFREGEMVLSLIWILLLSFSIYFVASFSIYCVKRIIWNHITIWMNDYGCSMKSKRRHYIRVLGLESRTSRQAVTLKPRDYNIDLINTCNYCLMPSISYDEPLCSAFDETPSELHGM